MLSTNRRVPRLRNLEALEQRQMFATHLLADINVEPVQIAPHELHNVGEQSLFFAQDGLWKTDGTEASLVKELNVDRQLIDATVLGDQLVFTASDFEHGQELWTSDGTAEGTRLLKDIVPGERDGVIRQLDQTFVEAGGELYFRSRDSAYLWKTDGTSEGTVAVTEDVRGAGYMYALNDELYFAADGGFWKWSDAGELESLYAGRSFSQDASDTHVFFTGQESDGSYSLFSIDRSDADPVELTTMSRFGTANGKVIGNTFYFVPPSSQELWQSDGTASGTKRLAAIQHLASVVGTANDQLLLGIDRPIGWIPIGIEDPADESEPARAASAMTSALRVAPAFDELWSYDLDTSESGHLTGWSSSAHQPSTWSLGEDTYFFQEQENSLWRTDGTKAGTNIVQADIGGGFGVLEAVIQDDALVAAGNGLWTVKDGKASKLPADTNRTQDSMAQTFESSHVQQFQSVGDHTLFIADNDLYRTDSSESGTKLVKSWLTEEPPVTALGYSAVQFVASPFLGSAIVSVATDVGHTFWVSDGTESGTTQIAELSDRLFPIHRTDEALYLRTIDGAIHKVNSEFEMTQVLSLDGIQGQSATPRLYHNVINNRLVVQIASFACGESPDCEWVLEIQAIDLSNDNVELISRFVSNKNFLRQTEVPLTRIGDSLAFIAVTDELQRAVWVTDGTSDGTEVFWHDATKNPIGLIPVGGVLLIETDGLGRGLYRSDGTVEGSTLVTSDFIARANRDFRTIGDNVVMPIADTELGEELWITDGENGHRVDIRPGVEGSAPLFIAEFNNEVYFTADDGIHGREIWVTDGTPENTRMLKDIAPGPDSSSARIWPSGIALSSFQSEDIAVTQRSDEFFFSATTAEHGTELWRSDGTSDGTELLADIAKGSDSSSPHSISVVGNDLYFAADGDQGYEPWVDKPDTDLLVGDADGNDVVNFADFLILSSNFGKSEVTPADGDFDRDGQVGFTDFLMMSANFGLRRILAE